MKILEDGTKVLEVGDNVYKKAYSSSKFDKYKITRVTKCYAYSQQNGYETKIPISSKLNYVSNGSGWSISYYYFETEKIVKEYQEEQLKLHAKKWHDSLTLEQIVELFKKEHSLK